MSDSGLRARAIRLAATLPAGSEARRRLLAAISEPTEAVKSAGRIHPAVDAAIVKVMDDWDGWGLDFHLATMFGISNENDVRLDEADFKLKSAEVRPEWVYVEGTYHAKGQMKRGDVLVRGDFIIPFETELDYGTYEEIAELLTKLGLR